MIKDPKQGYMTEDLREDSIIKDSKKNFFAENPRVDPINEEPKEARKEDIITKDSWEELLPKTFSRAKTRIY